MADFSKYFLMIDEDKPEETEKVVIEYTLLKTAGKGVGKIDWDVSTMRARIPASHGNLNHVCRITDGKGHSLYIKQAGDTLRISEDMTATLDRNRQESEILQIEESFAPGMVPHLYFYDTVMSASGMEDCSDYEVMRDAMLQHRIYEGFAEQIAEFMVNTLLLSSDIVMDHKEKKGSMKKRTFLPSSILKPTRSALFVFGLKIATFDTSIGASLFTKPPSFPKAGTGFSCLVMIFTPSTITLPFGNT